MKGIETILFALRAGYSFFYVRSWEQTRDAEQLEEAIRSFELNGNSPFSTYMWNMERSDDDPSALLNQLDELDKGMVMIANNYHWFIKDGQSINYEVVQKVINRVERYSTNENRKAMIIIGSAMFKDAIPDDLQKLFIEAEMTLPDEKEINTLLDNIITAASRNPKFTSPTEEEKELIVLNSRGMTSREITNAYAFSIIKDEGKLVPMTVGELQAKEISNTPGCSIWSTDNAPEPLGMEQAKLFLKKTLNSKKGRKYAKGVIYLGPAGTGKTMLVRWAAGQSGLKVIFVEPAELFGGIVGTTEKNVAKLIEVLKANAPCVVVIDEMEKGFAGMGKQQNGGSGSDGGLTEKAFAPLLKFLSDDRPEGIYFFATCNEIEKLPAAWIRAERWDAIFYVDLPNEEAKKAMLDYYRKEFEVEGAPSDMSGWTGAEIKTCCRLAAMMETTCNESERFVIPVSKTMKKEIDSLQKFAKDRCVPADMPVSGKVKKTDRSLEI